MSEYENGERLRRESPSSVRLVTVEQKVDNLISRDDQRHTDNKEEFSDIRSLVKEVLEQVKKTNGRVTGLESFRDKALGALAALTLAGGVLGFLFKILWDHAAVGR